jgi:hypothetical protein
MIGGGGGGGAEQIVWIGIGLAACCCHVRSSKILQSDLHKT